MHEFLPLPTRYTGATGTPMYISGLMDLDVQIADLCKSITFAFVDHLAVPLMIGTDHQDKLIESIQSKAHRLRPIDNRSVTMLDAFESSCKH